ncbi:MAG: ABC transporter ATP-binding protein [Magnetococcales bacterium]|nr:ABC transporter ATP-binding protein [Magnetococcales bacterium]
MSLPSMLKIESIDVSYGPVQAISGVSIHIDKGEIVTLIGANGAGKSTLLMAIFGAPQPDRGMVLFEGKDISRTPTHNIAQMGIALVPEGRRIFSAMTVEENLIMGWVPADGISETAEKERIMNMFPILGERRLQRAGTLSGGEQQMLAIGRALMSRPRLLLLDEPSLGLAPLIIQQIFKILKDIAKMGTTIFLVEQNANKALQLADRGYVLVGGKVQLAGTGQDLLHNPQVRKAYLGGH